MYLNYDFLFVAVASSFIVGGVILTYSFYNNIFPTINKGESLVNTNFTSDLSNNLATNISNSTLETTAPATHSLTLGSISNLPIHNFVDASVQTANIQVEAGVPANTYVNTGMQASARMWLESIKNWIT